MEKLHPLFADVIDHEGDELITVKEEHRRVGITRLDRVTNGADQVRLSRPALTVNIQRIEPRSALTCEGLAAKKASSLLESGHERLEGHQVIERRAILVRHRFL